jgi:hypothetical protein
MAVGSAKPVAIRLPAEMTPIKFSGAYKKCIKQCHNVFLCFFFFVMYV